VRAELAALELGRVSWARVRRGVRAVAEQFTRHDLLTYSSAMAFQALYAVLPVALLALAGLGLLGLQSVYTSHVAPTLQHDLSRNAYAIVNRTALKAMTGKRLWWASLGLLVSLWGVGAALRTMMTPLNGIYGARETRSWRRRLVESIAGGLVVMLCLGGALAVVLGGRLLQPTGVLALLVFVGRWGAALALLLVASAALIWFVPAKKRPIEWISVGSALSVLCWLVASVGFGAYISAVSYSSFYGALASLVLLLIYLHVSAIAVLLGVTVDSLLRDAVRGTHRRDRARTRADR